MSRKWAEGLDASYAPDGKVFSLACVKQSLKGEEDKWYLPIVQAYKTGGTWYAARPESC